MRHERTINLGKLVAAEGGLWTIHDEVSRYFNLSRLNMYSYGEIGICTSVSAFAVRENYNFYFPARKLDTYFFPGSTCNCYK